MPYAQYLFFILALASMLTQFGNVRASVEGRELRLFGVLFFLLFGVVIISAISGLTPFYGAKLAVILLITTLPFILTALLVFNHPPKVFLVPLFLVGLVSAVGATFLAWYGPVNIGGVGIINYLHGNRWSFLYQEANGLGWAIAVSITTLLYFVIDAKSVALRLFYLFILLPFLLFVFWKTNSRASTLWLAWSFLVFGMASLCFMYRMLESPRGFWKIIGLLSLVIIGIVSYMAYEKIYGFMRLGQGDITSGRFQVWVQYWQQFQENPLLGFGFGATKTFLEGQPVLSPLNVFIGMLGESGLLGFLLLLILWVRGFFSSVKIVFAELSEQGRNLNLALWVLAMLGGIALQQNGEWHIMRVSPLHYLFFFVVTIAWALGEKRLVEGASSYER